MHPRRLPIGGRELLPVDRIAVQGADREGFQDFQPRKSPVGAGGSRVQEARGSLARESLHATIFGWIGARYFPAVYQGYGRLREPYLEGKPRQAAFGVRSGSIWFVGGEIGGKVFGWCHRRKYSGC